MKFSLVALVTVMLMTGCANDIVQSGPDTYYTSCGPLPVWMSAGKAKGECYQRAEAWCQQRGLVMVPVSSDSKEAVFGRAGSAEFTFRAIKPVATNLPLSSASESTKGTP